MYGKVDSAERETVDYRGSQSSPNRDLAGHPWPRSGSRWARFSVIRFQGVISLTAVVFPNDHCQRSYISVQSCRFQLLFILFIPPSRFLGYQYLSSRICWKCYQGFIRGRMPNVWFWSSSSQNHIPYAVLSMTYPVDVTPQRVEMDTLLLREVSHHQEEEDLLRRLIWYLFPDRGRNFLYNVMTENYSIRYWCCLCRSEVRYSYQLHSDLFLFWEETLHR